MDYFDDNLLRGGDRSRRTYYSHMACGNYWALCDNFFGICLVLAAVRSTYYEGAITKALDRLLIISGVIQIALLMTVLTMSTLIQDQVMPKLGYSNCALLQGNPTLWFTDWIKNPEWCVHGKDRQWVHGQAKAAPPK